MNITSRLKTAADNYGEKTALRCAEERLSYATLHRLSESLAAALLARGVQRGEAFAVQGDNSLELLLLYYAAARLGAVFVPINQDLSAREVIYIINHVGSRLFLHDKAHSPVAEAAVAPDHRCTIADLLAEAPDQGLSADHAPGGLHEDFLVIYTSGSTGVPKAVVFDQANEIGGNQSLIDLWRIEQTDVTLVALPLGFLYGLSTAAATAVQAGGEVVVMRRFHPRDVLKSLIECRASIFHGVPTMFAMMLDYAEQNALDVDLSSVRLLISAGAALSEELRMRFEMRFNKPIEDYYALTEVRPIFGKPWGDPQPIPKGSLGKLAPGAQARMVDSEGKETVTGEPGEFLVRAPGMLVRYHRDADLTKTSLRDGWFRTGDLGRCDIQGNFFLMGRIKDIIIRGGANIAPAEIEEVLNAHPSIRGATVIGVAHEKYGEVPVAYIVTRDTATSADELRSFCANALADFKIPAAFITLDALPLGPTGKVDRKALQKMWRATQ